MSTIKERIVEVIEKEGVAKEAFYKKIGMTSSSFRSNAKKTPLNSDAIANVLAELPQINAHWLITGQGEMTVTASQLSKASVEILEKFYTLFESRENEHKTILGQNSEIIRQNSDIIKQNSEVMRQNGELIKIVSKFIEK